MSHARAVHASGSAALASAPSAGRKGQSERRTSSLVSLVEGAQPPSSASASSDALSAASSSTSAPAPDAVTLEEAAAIRRWEVLREGVKRGALWHRILRRIHEEMQANPGLPLDPAMRKKIAAEEKAAVASFGTNHEADKVDAREQYAQKVRAPARPLRRACPSPPLGCRSPSPPSHLAAAAAAAARGGRSRARRRGSCSTATPSRGGSASTSSSTPTLTASSSPSSASTASRWSSSSIPSSPRCSWGRAGWRRPRRDRRGRSTTTCSRSTRPSATATSRDPARARSGRSSTSSS